MNISALTPGQIRVIKRDGRAVEYNDDLIRIAITKAYMDPRVIGEGGAVSAEVKDKAIKVTALVSDVFKARMPSGGTIHIEEIQDQVELALMRSGEHQVARYYVLYREEHSKQRALESTGAEKANGSVLYVTNANGDREPLDIDRLNVIVKDACKGLSNVDSDAIISEALKNLFDGVEEKDVSNSLIMTARSLVEHDPEYSYVTARLLLDSIRNETLPALGVAYSATQSDIGSVYKEALCAFIPMGVEHELLSPMLMGFDLELLGSAIKPERDNQFTYLGLQTLYDRYFVHHEGQRLELPQVFFMRVAMGLALKEDDINLRAIEFYNLLSSFDYMSSTPTLFNAGTRHSQLSSCYLTTIPDDMKGITSAWSDNAMLSKWAGGLGNDWTPVRALGAHIKGTNGQSQGVVPFLKVANDIAVAVNQGGKRKGAVCAYLESWHLDIEEFLELRKNTGDDRRRTHDMNTANWIPDLFMKRLFSDESWTLFSPNQVPELHDLVGKAFEAKYQEYEAKAAAGDIKSKTIDAKALWRKMLGMIFETGHPWITFKDPCNLRSPQQHVGVVHSSNLCTEITLNTSNDEIAVCNLGSVNLAQHVSDDGIDREKLNATIKTAVRMLDNVIDINYYAVPQAEKANQKHRPVGLGIMGFQDALYLQKIPYSSEQAVAFADLSMELVSFAAIDASAELAKERGAYQTFEGSLWSQGVLPIDSIDLLAAERGQDFLKMDRSSTLDWDALREKAKAGMRNSNVMAIAPTATISNIVGVTQSIEPTYQNLFVKSNLSGEFTVINPYLVKMLKDEDLWDAVMVNDLKYYEGSLKNIERVPDYIKTLFATAFEVEPKWIIEAASRRQKWLDQAQSLNIYIAGADGKKLDLTYRMAWILGLKTTYYLRSLAATSTEKSTVNTGTLNAVNPVSLPKACSINDEDCDACQ
ncbi:ribonucleoside-diphosphate reductase subunit alpha [Teredinibacter purpureus]|uniref:ribonucleoside-diphosphate reductase subunit alpha n=1 Tax=Teredinibacter purpureus TaxID=2731756 RepID=UPI00069868B4|nr:ribonucleoside-diphosphate reductase subunit alpha [Teredinibacter purpureus]